MEKVIIEIRLSSSSLVLMSATEVGGSGKSLGHSQTGGMLGYGQFRRRDRFILRPGVLVVFHIHILNFNISVFKIIQHFHG